MLVERPLSERDLLMTWHWTDSAMQAAALWAKGEDIQIDGPAGMSMDILRHLCIIHHWTRWGRFLTNLRRHRVLREVYYQLARLTCSPLAVYLPDSGFAPAELIYDAYEGWNMATFLNRLRTDFGPPAPTIASIYQKMPDGTWIGPSYYIDHFADLQHDHLSAAADR
ncbi:MAG: hypothetical protein ACTHMR_23115 [Thermomicrobiales bacterium]